MIATHRILPLVLLTTIVACRRDDARSIALGPIDTLASPAAPGSGEPNLSLGPDDRVYLSWIEPAKDSGHALRFATLETDGWSAPGTVTQGSRFFVNWADFPSIVAGPGGRLAAHWLERSDTARYAYGVRIAQSSDGGATWSAPTIPHRDASPTEHGFVSLYSAGGSLGAVWLDGRNFAGAPEGAHPNMMLLTTAVARDGSAGAERVLDDRVCDCCQTSVAIAADGPVVAYRDRSPDEIRDIGVIRWTGTGWSPPTLVHADRWSVDHCPVNGPSVAANDQHVAVAWFTSARDSARVYLAQSADGGATFGVPVRIDDGNPVGRVDVAVDGRGGTLVSWMEFTSGQQAEVRVRAVSANRERSASIVAARSTGARASGFPHMVIAGGDVIFAWTEAGTPQRVRVARARLAGAR
ncbi:MAG: sialidase family protein [Gemmatimonadaceae bacterium]